MVRRANYVGNKFLLTKLKKDRKETLRFSGIMKTFDVSSPRKDKVTKYYYDTPNLFFRKNGINISKNVYSDKSYCDIVVRYDSTVTRIAFLSDMPDTFIKKISKRDDISKHYNYIATAMLELVPKGLNADAFDVIRNVRPVLVVRKKRERYRIINNAGLKLMFSFEKNVYYAPLNKTSQKLDMLEIRLESPSKTEEMYHNFIHKLHLQQAMFLKLPHSDLFIGQEYLDLEKTDQPHQRYKPKKEGKNSETTEEETETEEQNKKKK